MIFTKIFPQCLNVRLDAPILRGPDLFVEIENYLEHRGEDEECREDEAWLDVFSVLSFYLFDHLCSTKICCQAAFSHHWDRSARHLKDGVNRTLSEPCNLGWLPGCIQTGGAPLSAERQTQNSSE